MKIKDITLKNFGKYELVSASFDPNVTYLVGPNGAGKSTFGFTGVQFMFEGIAEKASKGNSPVIGERFRFIGPAAKSSGGIMTLYDEATGQEVTVTRTMTKDGNTVKFEGPAGMRLDQAWLTALFNEFMIAPKKFVQLSAFEQAKALGIDTTTFDNNIKALKEEYTIINRELTGLGTISPVEEVKCVDLNEVSAEKEAERKRLNDLFIENKEKNNKLRADYATALTAWNEKVTAHNRDIADAKERHDSAEAKLNDIKTLTGYDGDQVDKFLQDYYDKIKKPLTAEQIEKHQPKEPEYIEERPDSTTLDAIDARIMEASKTNIEAAKYDEYVKLVNKKTALENQLKRNKEQQEMQVTARVKYIKDFSFPFENLSVDESGGLMFDGRPIKEPYFSTGELIKMVPILFSALGNPLKSIFIQDFNLLDPTRQQEVEEYLTASGYQLIIEYVGIEEVPGKNCIVLSGNKIVNDQNE